MKHGKKYIGPAQEIRAGDMRCGPEVLGGYLLSQLMLNEDEFEGPVPQIFGQVLQVGLP